MPAFKRLLLASDFSDLAETCIEHAVVMREQFGAELHVAHVFDPSVIEAPAPYNFLPAVGNWLRENRESLRERSVAVLAEFQQRVPGECTTHLLEGNPPKELVRFAKEIEADCLIVGTHGHSNLGGLLLGSVAQYVVNHAACCVLTVPHVSRRK